MKLNKLIVLIILLLSGISEMNAQIYYYLENGKNLSEYQYITIAYFEGEYLQCNKRTKHEIVAKNSVNSNYYGELSSEQVRKYKVWEYDASLSNSKYDVYVKYDDGVGYYRAFSKDKKTLISWRERPGSNNVVGKTYYQRISSQLLNEDPHNFLN